MGTTAVILAGGKASRMHGEKPLRLLRGKTLLQHSLDLVSRIADEVLVASGNRSLPVSQRVDDPPEFAGQGPLAGILAGLEAAQHQHTIVLACDLPNVPPELLQRLLLELGEACACVYTRHSGHPEPLVAALETAAACRAVRKALSEGVNKVVPCWQTLPHRVLNEADLAGYQPLDRVFANINTLSELEAEENSTSAPDGDSADSDL